MPAGPSEGASIGSISPNSIKEECTEMGKKVIKADDEWRQELTPEQYTVCRRKGTERAFSGEYNNCKEGGIYQ